MSMIIVTVLVLGLAAWMLYIESDFAPFALIIGGVLLVFGWFAVVLNTVNFAPDMTRLAQTRAAIARLPCAATFSGSQVYGNALTWNQEIASNRVWNQRWVAEPFIPDGWDTVTMIVLPECPVVQP